MDVEISKPERKNKGKYKIDMSRCKGCAYSYAFDASRQVYCTHRKSADYPYAQPKSIECDLYIPIPKKRGKRNATSN